LFAIRAFFQEDVELLALAPKNQKYQTNLKSGGSCRTMRERGHFFSHLFPCIHPNFNSYQRSIEATATAAAAAEDHSQHNHAEIQARQEIRQGERRKRQPL
jgi:hypothetical protein